MFHVRTIYPEQRMAETTTHPFVPTQEETRGVRNLFDNLLAGRPGQFRDKLNFAGEEPMDFEWMSGPGGGAVAALYASLNPVSVMLLLPGDCSADDQDALTHAGHQLLEPILGADTDRLMGIPSYPLMVVLLVPGHPELRETLDVLHVALGSSYFHALADWRESSAAKVDCLQPVPQTVEWNLPG
jgi:hypothetical protein